MFKIVFFISLFLNTDFFMSSQAVDPQFFENEHAIRVSAQYCANLAGEIEEIKKNPDAVITIVDDISDQIIGTIDSKTAALSFQRIEVNNYFFPKVNQEYLSMSLVIGKHKTKMTHFNGSQLTYLQSEKEGKKQYLEAIRLNLYPCLGADTGLKGEVLSKYIDIGEKTKPIEELINSKIAPIGTFANDAEILINVLQKYPKACDVIEDSIYGSDVGLQDSRDGVAVMIGEYLRQAQQKYGVQLSLKNHSHIEMLKKLLNLFREHGRISQPKINLYLENIFGL